MNFLAWARAPHDHADALDHIVLKLARLPAMIQTAAGRALAAERLASRSALRVAFAAERLPCAP